MAEVRTSVGINASIDEVFAAFTAWEAPYRVDVLHTGRVVKGTGVMEVVPLAGGQSRFFVEPKI